MKVEIWWYELIKELLLHVLTCLFLPTGTWAVQARAARWRQAGERWDGGGGRSWDARGLWRSPGGCWRKEGPRRVWAKWRYVCADTWLVLEALGHWGNLHVVTLSKLAMNLLLVSHWDWRQPIAHIILYWSLLLWKWNQRLWRKHFLGSNWWDSNPQPLTLLWSAWGHFPLVFFASCHYIVWLKQRSSTSLKYTVPLLR